ncbi:MAG: aminoglycoside phosphotransferase family protein [Candidatus Saccharibacteria bacterium]|nr:aminoglycoside phosphotransferase family protein [Candidatus Saccharibacteria bacterium]
MTKETQENHSQPTFTSEKSPSASVNSLAASAIGRALDYAGSTPRSPITDYKKFIENSELKRLGEGTDVVAYILETPDGPEVVRFNKETDYGFKKDKFAAEHFASPRVPIPRVMDVGKWEYADYYAVSELVPGKIFKDFSSEEVVALTPVVVETLGALHETTHSQTGFGWWNPDGNGKHQSWRDTLIVLRDLGVNPELKSKSLFEPKVMEQIMAASSQLLPYCPEERRPIHGDPGHNILIDNGQVTGVIDWTQSMYGDPLFDVAKLDLHFPESNFKAVFKRRYESKGTIPQNFDERILCYQLLVGISDLVHFVKNEKETTYKRRKAGILKAIQDSGITFQN